MNKYEMKMIEEMAHVLCNKRCEDCVSVHGIPCGYKSYCTMLYNAGCRIIGEDEIVIKKDEYETLKAQNDTLELSVKDLRYRNAQFSEANKLFAKRNDELLDELQGATAIKEKTAREIFYKLKETLIINNEENTEWLIMISHLKR